MQLLTRQFLESTPDRASIYAPGSGRLEVELVGGRSTITSVHSSSPLKLLTPKPRGQSVWTYVSSFGGGLLGGDEINIDVKLAAGARCFLGTQASTKVYRNPESRPCGHCLRATVGEGALLVMAPEPVQAFAGASYEQQQQFDLASGASLALVDWVSAGRSARGERWQFRRYHSRNEVFIGGERVMLDSLLLDPEDGPLTARYRLGRFNCLAMALLIGEPLRTATERLMCDFAAAAVSRRGTLVASASPVAQGALLRFAGERVEDVTRTLREQLAFLTEFLGDDPWARRW